MVEHRLQSLTISHRARSKVLEDQIEGTTDEKIRRMKEGELARADRDCERRIGDLKRLADSADIHAAMVVQGVLTVTRHRSRPSRLRANQSETLADSGAAGRLWREDASSVSRPGLFVGIAVRALPHETGFRPGCPTDRCNQDELARFLQYRRRPAGAHPDCALLQRSAALIQGQEPARRQQSRGRPPVRRLSRRAALSASQSLRPSRARRHDAALRRTGWRGLNPPPFVFMLPLVGSFAVLRFPARTRPRTGALFARRNELFLHDASSTARSRPRNRNAASPPSRSS